MCVCVFSLPLRLTPRNEEENASLSFPFFFSFFNYSLGWFILSLIVTEKETRAHTLTQPMNLRRNEANGPEWGEKKQEHQFQNHWLFWADVLENGRDFSDDWISIDKYFLNLFEWRDLFSQFSSLNVYCFLDRLFSSRICHGRLEIAGPVALFFFFHRSFLFSGKMFSKFIETRGTCV